MKNIHAKSLNKDKKTEFYPNSLSGRWTLESLTPESLRFIKEKLMSLPQAFHANPSRSPDSEKQSKTKETSGLILLNAFTSYDHNLRIWRTCQACLLPTISDEFTETWPRQGIMRDGVCWELTIVECHTGERDGGCWPTPRSRMTGAVGPKRMEDKFNNLESVISREMFPSPCRSDALGGPAYKKPPGRQGGFLLKEQCRGGQLNPDWVEWLMGWPIGWTDLKPLGMDRFQKWLEQHGNC